jgi:hypothetical protein
LKLEKSSPAGRKRVAVSVIGLGPLDACMEN